MNADHKERIDRCTYEELGWLIMSSKLSIRASNIGIAICGLGLIAFVLAVIWHPAFWGSWAVLLCIAFLPMRMVRRIDRVREIWFTYGFPKGEADMNRLKEMVR